MIVLIILFFFKGKAGNPDVMDGVDPDMIVGVTTDVIAGEGLIISAGGIDSRISPYYSLLLFLTNMVDK